MGVVNTLKFLLRHLKDLFYIRARYQQEYETLTWNVEHHVLSVNQRNELIDKSKTQISKIHSY